MTSRDATTHTNSSLESNPGPKGVSRHNQTIFAVRRQAAAPPIYLLVLAVLPFFASVYIAGSRWWDFRHHAFDILFGYGIGTISAFFAFYYYHLPISTGAGWAWGPRSAEKAFWAGVGSSSYATDHLRGEYRGDEEEALPVVATHEREQRDHRNTERDPTPFVARDTGLSTASSVAMSMPGSRKPTLELDGRETNYRKPTLGLDDQETSYRKPTLGFDDQETSYRGAGDRI